MKPIKILFICLGNICRSPALEATLRSMIKEKGLQDKIQVDSCAYTSWFLDSKADPAMIEAALARGIHIDSRAKLFTKDYFAKFDYIFAVDKRLMLMLKSLAPTKKMAIKVHLATEFSQLYPNEDIQDPYGGTDEGFELTMDMAEDACRGILSFLERDEEFNKI